MTDNLDRRFKEHNSGKTKSTRFYRPWDMLFFESFENRSEARKREKYLKTGVGKEFIKNWSRSSAGYLPAGRQGA
ncbi:MAG: GIY-YIG nuclease family protein, partial [Bacteroidales bacterium]|nr:GIY-YIG nuclease family protein [Bacteroidales bacterium]